MRALDRLVVVLLAVVLVAVGVIGLVEIAFAAADRAPWVLPRRDWADSVRDLDGWSDSSLRVPAIALVAAGAGLVAMALWPRRPELLALTRTVEHHHDHVTRRGMEALLEESTLDDPEIRTASAKISRRRVAVTAGVVDGTHADAVRERVAATLRTRLAEVGVTGERAITVDVNTTQARVR